ncbi:hypothetical protein CI238_07281 [Colletotrichum incanum]|uniref:Uncharacterized protein n=1 Tax=Colletotrichum incanum TaxID=1573173 RepID=A0A167AEA0_COLIC|nr:hypothetical protein CI238_07281 [Colletotrichum incanum]
MGVRPWPPLDDCAPAATSPSVLLDWLQTVNLAPRHGPSRPKTTHTHWSTRPREEGEDLQVNVGHDDANDLLLALYRIYSVNWAPIFVRDRGLIIGYKMLDMIATMDNKYGMPMALARFGAVE